MNPAGAAAAAAGRFVGPTLARLWSAGSWAALGWTLSDITDFFGASDEDGNGMTKATQKVIGAALVLGILTTWLVLRYKRKRK